MLVWSTYEYMYSEVVKKIYELQKQADILYSVMHVLTYDGVKE